MTTPPLTARASASVVVAATVGRASPQRGDLQATSAPVAIGGPAPPLEIAETVR